MIFWITTFIVFTFDQIIKYFIARAMLPGQSIPLIKNILHLTYVQNRGAAFGLFYNQQGFLLIVNLIVMGIILYFHRTLKKSSLLQVPLGFILGGSLGNVFDRIFRHYVVDFIDIRIWPVFNLADSMINIGVFLIIIKLLFFNSKEAEDVSSSI